MAVDAQAVIQALRLKRHPEGGWYRETWRAPAGRDGRSAGTAIHFLLQPHERSAWHRIDGSELWLHQAGGPLRLRTSEGERVTEHRLGPDLTRGDLQQVVVAPGEWQSAEADEDWALMACVDVPGFEFSTFELAPPGWRPESS